MDDVEYAVAPSSDWRQGGRTDGGERNTTYHSAQDVGFLEFVSQNVGLHIEIEVEGGVQKHK